METNYALSKDLDERKFVLLKQTLQNLLENRLRILNEFGNIKGKSKRGILSVLQLANIE